MADNDNKKSFVEIEDELNSALSRIGEKREENYDDKISAITVQELLENLKIDEFEKMYITTAVQSNSPINEAIPEEKMEQVKTLAEYELLNRNKNEVLQEDEQEKLKSASNFYLIPHTVNQRVSIGSSEQNKSVDLWTVNDVEGYSLYTVIDDNNITVSSGFVQKIKQYLQDNYPTEIENGKLNVDEIVDSWTPNSMSDLYQMLGNERILSMRFLPDRIDEFVEQKGIVSVSQKKRSNEIGEREEFLEERDNLAEENKIRIKNQEKNKDENNELEENEDDEEVVEEKSVGNRKEKAIEEREVPENVHVESYIERIARMNHVSPTVVNTRIVENFEKVEEDTGIPLRRRYPRGEVVAVRIPYKLSYRTFLVEKSTGLTIDGKGRKDPRTGKLYDFDEIEDYFRYRLRSGEDGGKTGKPLRYDEGRDWTTFIDSDGRLKEKKYINNKGKLDMLRDERERYLAEVSEADQRLKDAIDNYQKNATHENYKKVREIVKLKVAIDNKYNALDEQRSVTRETLENTEKIIKKDLDDDDWFPAPPGERYR